eukprot:scaffold12492_cov98-Isochrysis_galbana.AAC.2
MEITCTKARQTQKSKGDTDYYGARARTNKAYERAPLKGRALAPLSPLAYCSQPATTFKYNC